MCAGSIPDEDDDQLKHTPHRGTSPRGTLGAPHRALPGGMPVDVEQGIIRVERETGVNRLALLTTTLVD